MSAFKNGGNYTYELNDTKDKITLIGAGVYVAIPNKDNTQWYWFSHQWVFPKNQ